MMSAKLTNQERKAIYRREGYRCALCDSTRYLQIHHVISRGSGGTNHPHNLICLCSDCHALAHGINLNDWDATQEDVEQAIVEYLSDLYAEEVWNPYRNPLAKQAREARPPPAALPSGLSALRRAHCVGGYRAQQHVPVPGPAPTPGRCPFGGHPSRLFFRRKAAPEQRGMRACSKTPGHHPARCGLWPAARALSGGSLPARRSAAQCAAAAARSGPRVRGRSPRPRGSVGLPAFLPARRSGRARPPRRPRCGGAVPGVRRASLAARCGHPGRGSWRPVSGGLRASVGRPCRAPPVRRAPAALRRGPPRPPPGGP